MTPNRQILVAGAMPTLVDALLLEMRDRGFAPALEVVESEKQLRRALGSQNWDAVIAEETDDLPVQKALKNLKDLNLDIPVIVIDDAIESSLVVRLIKQGVTNVFPQSKSIEICDALDQEINDGETAPQTGKSRDLFMIAESIFNSETDAIMLTDKHHRLKMVNDAFCRITNFSSKEVLGLRPDFLESGCQDVDFFETLWKEVNTKGKWQGEVWYRRKSGETFPVWLSVSAVKSNSSTVTHFMTIFRDITKSKRFEEDIIRKASYDALTELPNRTLFFDRLKTISKQAKRSNQKFAVLFLDLDRFKQVNDSRGHAIGDILLKKVAERLRNCVRDADTVSRLGGDEFAVIVTDINDRSGASLVAGKVLEALNKPFEISGEEASIGVSVGISLYPDDGVEEKFLLNHADVAMYHAKSRGRGQICYYQRGMTTPTAGNETLMSSPQAIAGNKRKFANNMRLTAMAMVILSIGLLSWAAIKYPAVPLAIMDLANFNTAAGLSEDDSSEK